MKILGLIFRGIRHSEVITSEPGHCKFILTVNADFVVRAREGDERLLRLINQYTSTFDGFWPWLIARLRYPNTSCDKISGSDLIFDFAERCCSAGRLLLIVGGSAHEAAMTLDRRAGSHIAIGWNAPFEAYPMSAAYIQTLRDQIEIHRPMVIAVCLGSPKQEFLIEDQLDFMSEHQVVFAYGAGGTADMLAGKYKRAPVIIQRIGLEGLWRLIMEPSKSRFKRLLSSLKIFRYIFD